MTYLKTITYLLFKCLVNSHYVIKLNTVMLVFIIMVNVNDIILSFILKIFVTLKIDLFTFTKKFFYFCIFNIKLL